MKIGASGNVGIGTTSPGYLLDVNGNWAFRQNGYFYGTAYAYEQSTNQYLHFKTVGGMGFVGMESSNPLTLQMNGGTVGIGTQNHGNYKLSVMGATCMYGGSANWNESVQGLVTGSLHLNPNNSTDHYGSSITFGASDSNNGEVGQAGIFVKSDAFYGTKMYFSTTDSYATGTKTAMMIDHKGSVGIGTATTVSHKLAINGTIGIFGGAANWNESVQGLTIGSLHLNPNNSTDHYGSSITFGASDSNNGEVGQAGIFVKSDAFYGTKMYFSTTDSYATGTKTAMMVDHKGNVGINTTNPDPAYKLSVNGSIRSKEVKVEAGWSDFVFDDDYDLRRLEEVETYIAENHHLPEIPSEAEVTENGINLGEMNAKLLQKIEELTLYLIEQNKQISELERKVKTLENQ